METKNVKIIHGFSRKAISTQQSSAREMNIYDQTNERKKKLKPVFIISFFTNRFDKKFIFSGDVVVVALHI